MCEDKPFSFLNESALGLLYKPHADDLERWIQSPTRRTHSRLVFKPDPSRCLDSRALNAWDYVQFRALEMPSEPETDLSVVMKLHELVCGGDEAVIEYSLNYQAHILQHPGEKVAQFMSFVGAQGAGKNMFWFDFFATGVLGSQLAGRIGKLKKLFARFCSAWENRLLMVVDESDREDFTRCYDKLKEHTGAIPQPVEGKGVAIRAHHQRSSRHQV